MKFYVITLGFVFSSLISYAQQNSFNKIGSFTKSNCNDSTCVFGINISSGAIDSLSIVMVKVTIQQADDESIFITDAYVVVKDPATNTVKLIGQNTEKNVVNGNVAFQLLLPKKIGDLNAKISVWGEQTNNGTTTNTLVYNLKTN